MPPYFHEDDAQRGRAIPAAPYPPVRSGGLSLGPARRAPGHTPHATRL